MDMQNVSNLQIPEGGVKTIHDGNGRLLWGAVGYDTKYAGDTTQVTYTGKNLIGGLAFAEQVIEAMPDATLDTTNQTVAFNGRTTSTNNIAIVSGIFQPNTQYTFINTGTTGNYKNFRWGYTDNTTDSQGAPKIGAYVSGAGKSVLGLFKVNNNNLNVVLSYEQCGVFEGVLGVDDFEPYTGGIPSPNPDYPQPANVVTGAQPITISDGIDSAAFPISLGSIELCKIDSYQDYIYKSGEDWYVHKSVKKINLNGAETWQNSGTNTFACSSISDYATSGNTGFSPFAKGIGNVTNGTAFSSTAPDQSFAFGDGTIADRLYWKSSNFANANEAKSWLQSNTPDLYYALATPIDTKITDATLVSQLNAVHQWATRYGYNVTVSGDLPIVLRRDSLQ